MKSFVVVHNITSPYRVHMFRVLNEQLQARGVAFHVHFMARSLNDRPRSWQLDSKDIPFPHTFWFDIGHPIKGVEWHLNPGMIMALMQHKADYLLVGGPWSSLTGLLISLLARRNVGIGWAEGNTKTPGRIGGWAKYLKQFLLQRFQILAVPGREGAQHASLFLDASIDAPKIVTLPNIVDETMFNSKLLSDNERYKVRTEFNLDPKKKLALWPARLIPAKGVGEFLSQLTTVDIEGWNLLILGEGPLERSVLEVISENNLENYVHVLSYFPYEKMPSLYRAADLFLLPSLRDPNPLSVVEAMHSGLPIVISNQIGNYPEALREGENGWGLDAFDPDSVRRAVHLAFNAPVEQLREMGAQSQIIAANFWGSHRAINAFLDAIPVQNETKGKIY